MLMVMALAASGASVASAQGEDEEDEPVEEVELNHVFTVVDKYGTVTMTTTAMAGGVQLEWDAGDMYPDAVFHLCVDTPIYGHPANDSNDCYGYEDSGRRMWIPPKVIKNIESPYFYESEHCVPHRFVLMVQPYGADNGNMVYGPATDYEAIHHWGPYWGTETLQFLGAPGAALPPEPGSVGRAIPEWTIEVKAAPDADFRTGVLVDWMGHNTWIHSEGYVPDEDFTYSNWPLFDYDRPDCYATYEIDYAEPVSDDPFNQHYEERPYSETPTILHDPLDNRLKNERGWDGFGTIIGGDEDDGKRFQAGNWVTFRIREILNKVVGPWSRDYRVQVRSCNCPHRDDSSSSLPGQGPDQSKGPRTNPLSPRETLPDPGPPETDPSPPEEIELPRDDLIPPGTDPRLPVKDPDPGIDPIPSPPR